MNPDLHYALLVAEQRRRDAAPRHGSNLAKPPFRHQLGDALISLGLRLRGRPPDPSPAFAGR